MLAFRGTNFSKETRPMRYLALAALAALLTTGAYAQMGASCSAGANEKKLSGAAKSSYLKKCEGDAKSACDASATEKKLSGAARTSFTKKCVQDKVGS
jgi:hypothetical protein